MEEEEKVITATSEDQLWDEIIADFKRDPDPLEYHAVLEQNERRVVLDIFNNHAVGFEAVAYTTFSSYIFGRDNFKFSVHNQSFTDEIGKFFGMQDIILGFKDFDSRFVVKANDENRTAKLFADQRIRDTLLSLPHVHFAIVEYEMENGDGKAPFLELKVDRAITDPLQLRQIYSAFFEVLLAIE
jgi:hypothetical protein